MDEGADPTNVPSPDPSAEPSVGDDAFGPPHAQAISDTLQLWILIPGLIGLILIGEQKNLDDMHVASLFSCLTWGVIFIRL